VTETTGHRTWRVRGWVRAITLTVPVLFLAPVLWPASFNPTWINGMPADQYPSMALFYLVLAVCIWASFRSRLDLTGDTLTVTNPCGSYTIRVDQVWKVVPGSWGTELHLTGGQRRLVVFAVQCTYLTWGEKPRWVGVAEALTGQEPEWRIERED